MYWVVLYEFFNLVLQNRIFDFCIFEIVNQFKDLDAFLKLGIPTGTSSKICLITVNSAAVQVIQPGNTPYRA